MTEVQGKAADWQDCWAPWVTVWVAGHIGHRGPASQQVRVRPVEDYWATCEEGHAVAVALVANVLFEGAVVSFCSVRMVGDDVGRGAGRSACGGVQA